jgi:hypothetical protein
MYCYYLHSYLYISINTLMTTSLSKLYRYAAVAGVAFALLCLASFAYAADATLTANLVTPASIVGANTQTNATSSSVANVAQVKATRTLTVGTAPTDAQNLTIGLCTITFATTTGAAQDLNCAGGATIRTANVSQVAYTQTEIATTLQALTGVTDTGHGAITVTSSSTSATSAVFTTTGTETTATAITYSAGTASGITSTNSVSGTIPVAQVWIVTPANVEVGDTFRAIINGTTVSYVATAATVANVTAGLTAAINANGTVSPAVTAANGGTQITVTSDTAGTAFTLTSQAVNALLAAQVVTFTPANLDDANLVVTINGTEYNTRSSDIATLAEVVESLNIALAAAPDVTCTEDDAKVTCTGDVAGTSFTYSTSVGDIKHSGGGASGSSGGGSSSHSSRSSSSTHSTPAVTTTTTATTGSGTGSATSAASVDSFPDMEVGVTSANVTTIQAWLISKGYSIPAGATGYFGAQTKAALAAYQAASGITPASGYFGPKTRAYISAHP